MESDAKHANQFCNRFSSMHNEANGIFSWLLGRGQPQKEEKRATKQAGDGRKCEREKVGEKINSDNHIFNHLTRETRQNVAFRSWIWEIDFDFILFFCCFSVWTLTSFLNVKNRLFVCVCCVRAIPWNFD